MRFSDVCHIDMFAGLRLEPGSARGIVPPPAERRQRPALQPSAARVGGTCFAVASVYHRLERAKLAEGSERRRRALPASRTPHLQAARARMEEQDADGLQLAPLEAAANAVAPQAAAAEPATAQPQGGGELAAAAAEQQALDPTVVATHSYLGGALVAGIAGAGRGCSLQALVPRRSLPRCLPALLPRPHPPCPLLPCLPLRGGRPGGQLRAAGGGRSVQPACAAAGW